MLCPTVHEAFAEAREANRYHRFSHPAVRMALHDCGTFFIRNMEENKALADFTKSYLNAVERCGAGLAREQGGEPLPRPQALERIQKLREEFE